MNTLYAELRSGIGNQLFQFAFAYSLAKKYNYELVLCPSFYPGKVKYFLKKVLGREAREFLLPLLIEKDFKEWKGKEMNKGAMPKDTDYIDESTYSDDVVTNLTKSGRNIFLSGYWQNPRFFADYKRELEEIILPRISFSDTFQEISTKLNEQYVGIHVRRGDFLTNKAFGACTREYYLEAIRKVKERVSTPKFIIFTNDRKWVHSNLIGVDFEIYASPHRKNGDIEEFFLLSQFKSIIISNSTFSWWASFLHTERKFVICPAKWFAKESLQATSSALIQPGWLALNNKLEYAS